MCRWYACLTLCVFLLFLEVTHRQFGFDSQQAAPVVAQCCPLRGAISTMHDLILQTHCTQLEQAHDHGRAGERGGPRKIMRGDEGCLFSQTRRRQAYEI